MDLRTIDDLRPAPYNPRKIGLEAMHGLKRSIGSFGDISGIVWNSKTGHLVAGHQRLTALRTLYGDGLLFDASVPCLVTPTGERFNVRVVDWDLITEKAANVAANAPTIAGEFTGEVIEILDELREEIPDLVEDLRLDEIKIEFEDKAAAAEDEDGASTEDRDAEKEAKAAALVEKWGVARGQVWSLGPHRLLCGDSMDAACVSRLLAEVHPAGMIMDPPFNVDYSAWSIPESVRCIMVWARGSPGLLWTAKQIEAEDWGVSTLAFSGQARGWARPEWPSLVHEICYILRREVDGRTKGKRLRCDPCLAYDLRVTADNRPFSFYENLASRRNDMSWAKNPACFAVWMCFMDPGEIVYDPCCGSGSSILAADRSSVRLFGIEMQEKWVAMSLDRYHEQTGIVPTVSGSSAAMRQARHGSTAA